METMGLVITTKQQQLRPMKKIMNQQQALEVYPWLMTCTSIEKLGWDFNEKRYKYKCYTERSEQFMFVVTKYAKTKAGVKMYSNMPVMAFYDNETAKKYLECLKKRKLDGEVKFRFSIVDFHELNTFYNL